MLRTGFVKERGEMFSGTVYLSPDLPASYIREKLLPTLRARPGYGVQFNQPGEDGTL